MIGRLRIDTFPVTEAKGIIFVFMGDVEPPPLADDVPPTFLDDDIHVRGRRTEVQANWRIGCENGFDSTHVFIHRHSVLVKGNDLILPLGMVPIGKQVDQYKDRAEFDKEFDDKWCEMALQGFNNDDIWAREAQQEYYRYDEAWTEEHLYEADRSISVWRQLASKRNRGILKREHLDWQTG